MPELVQLFRLFVGAPSDVTNEHSIIRGLVEECNQDHGPATGARTAARRPVVARKPS